MAPTQRRSSSAAAAADPPQRKSLGAELTAPTGILRPPKRQRDDPLAATSKLRKTGDDTTAQPTHPSKHQLQSQLSHEADPATQSDLSLITPSMSSKILKLAQQQQSDYADAEEEEEFDVQTLESLDDRKLQQRQRRPSVALSLAESDIDSNFGDFDDEDEGDEFQDEDTYDEYMQSHENELSQLDEEELNMIPSSNSTSAGSGSRNLADLIMAKIHEKQHQKAGGSKDGKSAEQQIISRIEPSVRAVYQQVAVYLKHYRAGKIPKAFKIIPALKQWEEVLFITRPTDWSPQSVYAATKLFASNLNPKMAQRYYALVLLPRIRKDIENHKKLNYHLYQAIKKAIYKPSAFFKGLLLPLVEDDCTGREAWIVSSILAKCSIPVLHSAVALMKLCELDYSMSSELFIKTLLNKKYSLPYRVLNAVFEHYMTFLDHKEPLPVIWHQSVLVFIQRYKLELSPTQRKQIRELIKKQQHHQITSEIRRELAAPIPIMEPGSSKSSSRSAAASPALSAFSQQLEMKTEY